MSTKNPAPNSLRAYFESYGFDFGWDSVVAAKGRADGCYYVLLVKDATGLFLVDIAGSSYKGPWQMQNDSSDYITMKEWRALRVDAYCDTYHLPGD